MRKFITPLCLIVLFFYGCIKPDTPIPHIPDCQIVKLRGEWYTGLDSAVFSYNSKGNPTSMTRSWVGTGSPDYLFRYDKKNRLTDVIGVYSDANYFETWHHYVYDNKRNLPVADSVYTFGEVGNGPLPLPGYYSLRYADLSYDSYGRIVKAVDVDVRPYPGQSTSVYHYNAVGNLDAITTSYPSGEVLVTDIDTYDNKVNLHRTNPVWQLIDRDYSVNNAFTAVSYSSNGLPTVIGTPTSHSMLLGYITIGEMEIIYSCQQSSHNYTKY